MKDTTHTMSVTSPRDLMWLGLVTVIFCLVRLPGIFGELWLDEVWTLTLIDDINSPLEILTKIRHDNNQPVNTLWMYLVHPTSHDWLYRLFSWLISSASVFVAGLSARKLYSMLNPQALAQDINASGVLAALLFGGSYLLIHYGTEARGYAPAMAFSLMAVYALLHAQEKPWSFWVYVYWVSCMLALLSHLLCIQIIAAGGIWSLASNAKTLAQWRDKFLRAVWWHAVPALGFIGYYLAIVTQLEKGGGPINPFFPVLGETTAYLTGMPVEIGKVVAIPLVLGTLLITLALIWRKGEYGRMTVMLCVVAIFAVPVAGAFFSETSMRYPRHFIVSALLALLICGYAIALAWNTGKKQTIMVLMALFFVGNAFPYWRLVKDGRSHYQAALHHMYNHTVGEDVKVSTDHDFRHLMMLSWYYDSLELGRPLSYFPSNELPEQGVDWIIFHSFSLDEPIPTDLKDAFGNRFGLDTIMRYSQLSGWNLHLLSRR